LTGSVPEEMKNLLSNCIAKYDEWILIEKQKEDQQKMNENSDGIVNNVL